MSRALVLATLLAACGDDPKAGSGDPVTITIATAQPDLVMVRDLDGPWTAAMPTHLGGYVAEVTGPYLATVVCVTMFETIYYETYQFARTPDDPREIVVDCDPDPARNVVVDGHMVQAGRVNLGIQLQRSETANWDYEFSAAPGKRDLVAFSTDRVALRRGIEIAAPGPNVIAPAIDLATEGGALAPSPITIANAQNDESTSGSVRIANPETLAILYDGAPEAARAAAPDALIASDDQVARVAAVKVAGTQSYTRQVLRHRFAAAAATFTLPDALPTVDLGGDELAATWSALPAYDELVLEATSGIGPDPVLIFEQRTSARFVAATASTSTSFDLDIPGYLPEWTLNAPRAYRYFEATRKAGEDDLSSYTSLAPTPLQGRRIPAAALTGERALRAIAFE